MSFREALILMLICWNAQSSLGYIGITRYKNGTDLELREIRSIENVRLCGDTEIFGGTDPVFINSQDCGYNCAPQFSSYLTKTAAGSALSCKSNTEIRQEQKCFTGGIGTIATSNEIQVLSIADLSSTKKTLYHNSKRASRCELKSGCGSIEYRNISTGWQPLSIENCFEFSVNTENFTNAFATVKITCSSDEIKGLEGLMLKMSMSCHIDDDNKAYDTCFLLKIQGTFKEGVTDSLDKTCAPIIIPSVIPTTKSPASSSDDDSFMVPYGIIIIIFILLFILLVIGICFYKRRQRRRRDEFDIYGSSKTGVTDNNNTDEKPKIPDHELSGTNNCLGEQNTGFASSVDQLASNGHTPNEKPPSSDDNMINSDEKKVLDEDSMPYGYKPDISEDSLLEEGLDYPESPQDKIFIDTSNLDNIHCTVDELTNLDQVIETDDEFGDDNNSQVLNDSLYEVDSINSDDEIRVFTPFAETSTPRKDMEHPNLFADVPDTIITNDDEPNVESERSFSISSKQSGNKTEEPEPEETQIVSPEKQNPDLFIEIPNESPVETTPGVESPNYVTVDMDIDDKTGSPFARNDSILTEQLFKQFGLDSQGNFANSEDNGTGDAIDGTETKKDGESQTTDNLNLVGYHLQPLRLRMGSVSKPFTL